MEPDRKSHVSSFYGDRRASYNTLANPAPGGNGDRSSFFGPDGALPPGAQHSAGYNRQSYMDAGRAAPVRGGYAGGDPGSPTGDEWDVYADFNNAGPKYSSAFGRQDASYRPIHSPQPSSKVVDDDAASGAPVELVTVPALGPEWGADEMRGATRRGRRAARGEQRSAAWRAFNRGERGLCGIPWLGKRALVFGCFAFAVAVGITLAFTIPRVPAFLFNAQKPLLPADGWWNASIPTQFSRSPTNFSFPAYVDIQVDTSDSYLPLSMSALDATVYDLLTGARVAVGHMNKTRLPAKEYTTLQVPLNFTFAAVNTSDVTWNNWHNGCVNHIQYTNGSRPAVEFTLVLEFSIAGLIGTKSTSTQVNNANCPIELPTNAS